MKFFLSENGLVIRHKFHYNKGKKKRKENRLFRRLAKKAMSEKKHLYYFDFLRLIAAVCVIYMHAAAGPLRGEINAGWQAMNVLTSFSFTAVPLFMMMSGYLLLSSERTPDVGVLLKKRLPRLLVPLLAWTVIAILYLMYRWGETSPAQFLSRLAAALDTPVWVHFWYMYTLVALYLIAPVLCGGLRALDRKGHLFVLTLIGLVSLKTILQVLLPARFDAYLNIDLIEQITFFDGHLATFVLGYYLGSLKRRIPNGFLIAASLLLLGVIIGGTACLSLSHGGYDAQFQNQSSGFEVLLAACIFLLFKQNCNRPTRLFRVFPAVPLTYGIYFMHNILLGIMLENNPAVTFGDTLGATALNFAICYLVLKTAATVKPLCFVITGISYKEACESCNWVYTFRRVFRRFAH